MSGTPAISIIIATYNTAKDIGGCLDSIAAQSFNDLEVVIVDGGSTDQTMALVKSYAARFPLKWCSEKDNGIYDALNKGVKMASGRWLYFLGADDRVLPGFSELAGKLEDEHAVYYGITREYHSDGRAPVGLLTGEFSKYRMAKGAINHQAILYPAAVFQHYAYNLRYRVYSDYELNIRVWGDTRFKKLFYPIPVVSYNMTGFSANNPDTVFLAEKPGIIRESFGWLVYVRFMLKEWKRRRKQS
ncbi:Glycosyltransferase involved in cell wall bisynthesis [Chitinophaga eiseniae]|uniref:Glycosyltransferase involved in cell wall bisynthesis n=1 Tax=Chitinophaga eiseniae TaxID=634771 RepID=A0A1T4U541_9BACT|nr:glycosyltransferase family 2 protein [Chitinophaga eiseniae]SKA47845.1 Glycosyltransferase involved in cell wall bisynthesis [Chitinophaga eiseniae]